MAQAMVKAGLSKDQLLIEVAENIKPKYSWAEAPKIKSVNDWFPVWLAIVAIANQFETEDVITFLEESYLEDNSQSSQKAPRISLKAKVYLSMLSLEKKLQRASEKLSEVSNYIWDNTKLVNKLIGSVARRVLVLKARLAESEALFLKA